MTLRQLFLIPSQIGDPTVLNACIEEEAKPLRRGPADHA